MWLCENQKMIGSKSYKRKPLVKIDHMGSNEWPMRDKEKKMQHFHNVNDKPSFHF